MSSSVHIPGRCLMGHIGIGGNFLYQFSSTIYEIHS